MFGNSKNVFMSLKRGTVTVKPKTIIILPQKPVPIVKPKPVPIVKPNPAPIVKPVAPIVKPNPVPIVNSSPVVHVLLIEADNQRNLGGSCLRDVVNMDYYVNEFSKQTNIARGQTVVLSIDNDPKIKSKFTTKNIVFDKLNNYKSVFSTFTDNVKPNDYAFISVSGHGYQKTSKTGEETDKLDEYIAYNGGIILDNELNSLLASKLSKTKRTFCLGDTCHSGTLFDINDIIPNVCSLSACLDNQLDSCDVGYNAGFGGALTVQLLDIPNPIKTLLMGQKDEINTLVAKLSAKLKLLNQKPLLCGI
jgi:hypothetical protein